MTNELLEDEYIIRGVSLNHIRNQNEDRVVQIMPDILDEFSDRNFSDMDIEDIFALTLGRIPPRYIQYGSRVNHEEVTDERIEDEVRRAVNVVTNNPR